jgi:ribokinase
VRAAATIAVVGSANVDLVSRCRDLPRAGETVVGSDLERFAGGKGANQAVATARLGARASLISCVGDDESGRWLRQGLLAAGVAIDLMQCGVRPTGTAMIAVDERGENLIVVAPGANAELSLEKISVEPFDAVLAQLELPLAVIEEAARRAKRFVLNAAPARAVSPELLARCDVVIVNESEAANFDLELMARAVVTLGARGAEYLERGKRVAHCSAPRVEAEDTVGAGDAFCAAFTCRYVAGDTPIDALRYATTAGALATRRRGAQGSLPDDEEVRQWMASAS